MSDKLQLVAISSEKECRVANDKLKLIGHS